MVGINAAVAQSQPTTPELPPVTRKVFPARLTEAAMVNVAIVANARYLPCMRVAGS